MPIDPLAERMAERPSVDCRRQPGGERLVTNQSDIRQGIDDPMGDDPMGDDDARRGSPRPRKGPASAGKVLRRGPEAFGQPPGRG